MTFWENSMRAYDEYKDSGYDWLEKIPAHWKCLYLFQICHEQYKKNGSKEELPVLSLSYGKIIIKRNINFGLTPNDYSTYQVVTKGNIILRLTDLQNDQKSLRTGLVKSHGIITSAYTCISTYCNPDFIHYILHAYDCHKIFYGFGGGVRQSIGYAQIKNIKLPVPPSEEQDAIVRFLDAKCAKIDRLIKLKERQIALLNEKKQLIINQAVTRGLDPNVPMKDSGVDWIGEIPEGWEVSKLKYIGVIQTGVTLGKDYPKETTSEYPYLCVANVQDGYIDLKKIKFINLPPKEAQRYFLQKGDILMTEGGDPDKLGRGSVWNNEIAHCLHQNHIFAVRMDQNKVLISFFRFVLQAQYCKEYFLLSAKQTTNLASTNKTTLSNLYVAIPSLDEQEKIVEQLDKVVAIYKKQIKIIEKEILTLREYKTKIISDCVTGKLNCIADNDITIG